MSVAENKQNIEANRRRIFELENRVRGNRGQAYATRALVSENAALINKNYQAAFMGNRQLANQNTEDLFRNRFAIIRNIQAKNDVEVNYKEARMNQAKLDFLEHRARLNERVLSVSDKLAALNRQAIGINRDVMDGNETIVEFNAKKIEENSKFLAEGIDASKATPESNAQLIAENTARIAAISKKSEANKTRIEELLETTQRNRVAIRSNAESIHNRRERILVNRKNIHANQDKVAKFIAAKL